jgi:hypothetical protein
MASILSLDYFRVSLFYTGSPFFVVTSFIRPVLYSQPVQYRKRTQCHKSKNQALF